MEVVEASGGAQALLHARGGRPDLIILDIAMPDLDGWHVAQQLRADPATAPTPLIFLSATVDPDADGHATDLDALLLAKPFDPLGLPRLIRRAVRQSTN